MQKRIGLAVLGTIGLVEQVTRHGRLVFGMVFDEMDLREADFGRARLLGGTFHGADLHNANLEGANLRSADLSGAVNLTLEQVLKAEEWDMDIAEKPTQFPSDIEAELSRRGMRKKESQ